LKGLTPRQIQMSKIPEEIGIMIYQDILEEIKKYKVKVFHRKIDKNFGGLYDPVSKLITVNKDDQDTIDGCFYLLHEFGHYLDHKKGKYKNFYNSPYCQEFSTKSFIEVVKAEQSASSFAVKYLRKNYSISYLSDDITKEGIASSVNCWISNYFL